MKYIKMLGLLAMTAAALMVFAGAACATTLTAIPPYTGPIQAVSEGELELHGPIGSLICNESTVEGNIESHGAGVAASGQVATLDFSQCNEHLTVLKRGSLSIVGKNPTGNGTVTWTGAELTIVYTSRFGAIHCIYATNNTSFGTIAGAQSSAGHATLHIEANIPRVVTSGLCGSDPAELTGSYQFTVPTGHQIH
jgi:hypothetical protein